MQLDLGHPGAQPSVKLKAFLKERRDRLRPEAFGLPRRDSRRSCGLRREDIAELLGVSPLWYSLFESGTSRRRFSADFLSRLQDALQLDASDREVLIYLAVASNVAAPEVEVQWYSARLASLIDRVSDAAKRIASAPPEVAADIAQSTWQSVLAQLLPEEQRRFFVEIPSSRGRQLSHPPVRG